VWPDRVAGISDSAVAAIWLTASAATVRSRIYSASRYAELVDDGPILVDKFVGRSIRYNEIMLSAVRRLGLACADVDDVSSPEALLGLALQIVDRGGRLG
jgi:hypothetical protein